MRETEGRGPTYSHLCRLVVRSGVVPSFKNEKRVTESGGLITGPEIKQRMKTLEDAIVSALYSSSPTTGSETGLEWLRRLRTALSGLSDDSVREIPESSFSVERVEKGLEGVVIEIEEIEEIE